MVEEEEKEEEEEEKEEEVYLRKQIEFQLSWHRILNHLHGIEWFQDTLVQITGK